MGAPARSSATREAILSAAEEIFGARGFSKTSLEDIAAAAKVSRPLVYRYFGDKKGLFAIVVRRVLTEWNEVLAAEAARTTPGTAHTLRLVLTTCLDFAHGRSVLRGLLVRDRGLVRSQIGDVLNEGRHLLARLIEKILAEGVARGDVRSDLAVEDLAHVISEVFVSYTLLVLEGRDDQVGEGREGRDDQVGERRVAAVIETLLHGVIAPAQRSLATDHAAADEP